MFILERLGTKNPQETKALHADVRIVMTRQLKKLGDSELIDAAKNFYPNGKKFLFGIKTALLDGNDRVTTNGGNSAFYWNLADVNREVHYKHDRQCGSGLHFSIADDYRSIKRTMFNINPHYGVGMIGVVCLDEPGVQACIISDDKFKCNEVAVIAIGRPYDLLKHLEAHFEVMESAGLKNHMWDDTTFKQEVMKTYRKGAGISDAVQARLLKKCGFDLGDQ